MTGWKVWTHDGRSPLQGGDPILTGTYPLTLPRVALDRGPDECAAGWHFTRQPETALRIAGLWSTGRPAILTPVEDDGDGIERGDKCRAAQLAVLREATADEWTAALTALSQPLAPHVDMLVAEQQAWRRALARPEWAPARVSVLLAQALDARGLPWTVRELTAEDAWEAWETWGAEAEAAWGAAEVARTAWNAWGVEASWAVRAAWGAETAGAVRAAWAARDALTVQYVRRMGWQPGDPAAWTVGIREAYQCGLELALPTGPTELGWAMVARREATP